MIQPDQRRQPSSSIHPTLLFAFSVPGGLAAAAFFVLRPGGRWSENDTVALAEAIAGAARAQHLVPTDVPAYTNGYAYQAVAAFLLSLCGIPVSTFQRVLSPFLFVLLILPIAWVAYREFAGSAAAATLATSLLVIEPEFLFIVLRGSHEKVTRALMLLALLLLVRSFRVRKSLSQVALHVLMFYIVGYGLIASNNLFGLSFVLALCLAVTGSWLLSRRWNRQTYRLPAELNRRLLYSITGLLCLVFLFAFYAYTPAADQLRIYHNVLGRVYNLLSGVGHEQPAGQPYARVVAGWVGLPVYFLVSLANWLLIVASLAFWLRDAWLWFVRRQVPPSPAAWLLWLLYPAFTVQVPLSIVVDLSGALGENLQHRTFASFVLVAVAVVARGATPLLTSRATGMRWARSVFAVMVGCLAVLGVLKATNEPILSNKWTFYTPQEIQALHWAYPNTQYAAIWTDFDERLDLAYELTGRPRVATGRDALLRDFLISDVTRLRASRMGYALPATTDDIRTYDNGSAQLYHLVPLTPYQR